MKTVSERIKSRSVKNGDCSEWTGSQSKGYGYIKVDGKMKLVHRVAYEIESGKPIPSGLQVCHSCDNPLCNNPKHLFLGTHKDNAQDKVHKGRGKSFGVKQRIKPCMVKDICDAFRAGVSQSLIASWAGVSQSAISLVVAGKNFKEVVR